MGWIDTHCHLESFEKRGELEDVLGRAVAAGVERVVTIGTRLVDWQLYSRLAREKGDLVSWTAGLHPCDVEEDWEEQLAALPTFFLDDPEPVAIGEIGLDHFHLPKFPDEAAEVKSRQEKAFRQQLELAVQFEKPVVVHSRNAFEACVRVIDESPMDWSRVVFHCFADGADAMRKLAERGGYGSFTGILTYPKSEGVRDALKEQGVERLMVETDAPYLSPQVHRGKRNEPGWVVETGKFAAGELGVAVDVLAAKTTECARRFFRLP